MLTADRRTDHGAASNPTRPRKLTPRTLLTVAPLAAYFVYFFAQTAGGLTSWFSDDDLMNLHYYWNEGWASLIRANVLFFTEAYRPAAGIYYLGLYSLFGLSSAPFRILALALCAFNVLLLFLIARKLSASYEVALSALILGGFNATFVSLYYDTGMIYDVLAFTFYFSAFLLYISIRSSRGLRWYEAAAVILLQIAGLNSKEAAISLPVALCLYELIWRPESRRGLGSTIRWFAGPAKTASLSVLVNLVWIVGKTTGPGALLRQPGYTPQFSVDQFLNTYGGYLKAFCYSTFEISPAVMACILVSMLVAGFLLRDKLVLFASVMVVMAFLPIAFIPQRAGFAFYIPAFYWVLWAAAAIAWARARTVSLLLKLGSAKDRVRNLLIPATQVLLCAALAAYFLPLHADMFLYPLPVAQKVQTRNRAIDSRIHQLLPALPHGARILLLHDPHQIPYQAGFLVRLSYRDPSLMVDEGRIFAERGTVPDPNKYDFVLDYVNDNYIGTKLAPAQALR